MAYSHWFVSRQKRQLTTILQALIAYNDVCIGKVWTRDLQLELEDALGNRSITEHGTLRARRSGSGGGGTRTLFKQMKDLGLVFIEDENRKCRLTLIGEELVKGNITFVNAMRLQLKKYQYPSATSYSGTGSIDSSFRVHPFQFMLRLLKDARLNNTLSTKEMYGIVIHYATSDSDATFDKVVKLIVKYRRNAIGNQFVEDDVHKTYWNIANTFFNYLNMTQYIDRGAQSISIRVGKEAEVDAFIDENPTFIPNPEITENYIRAYGKGNSAKDLRNFEREHVLSQRERNEARIRHEYVLLALKTPITGITQDIVQHIMEKTGIDERTVESFLIQNYPHGNISDFFLSYKEFAHMGTAGAKDFELATCEMFKKIFKMEAKYVAPLGNTPDVFIESKEAGYCGIIDNKAYHNGYSITGNHKRVMEDVYIPTYQQYGETQAPLAFFTYIAGSFKSTINTSITQMHRDTGINGSAMPVDLMINLAQDYAEKGYTHEDLKTIFSVNREISISDLR